MKKALKGLGFRKMDEMDKSIQLKSIRLAWIYTIVFLLAWCFYEIHIARLLNERVNTMPLILLISQNLILGFSQLFWHKNMAAGEDEGTQISFMKVIAIIAIVIIIFVVIGIFTRLIIG